MPIAQMQAFAAVLAKNLRPGDIITLSGEVGAGKTAFARALIQAIAIEKPDVTSPTFNLLQSYDVMLAGGVSEILWHLDLYRLKHAEEADSLGLRELWSHITLIEWPEIIARILPVQHLSIAFDFGVSQELRNLVLSGNDAWRNRLETLI